MRLRIMNRPAGFSSTAAANTGHDTRRIQDWLGHRSIAHTTRYTQLSAAPFKDFWR
jgi:site-specific recombinase XerD